LGAPFREALSEFELQGKRVKTLFGIKSQKFWDPIKPLKGAHHNGPLEMKPNLKFQQKEDHTP